MTAKIRNSISALKDEIAAYRHALHENPGTAYEEFFASDLVAEKLGAWGIPFERGLAKTGIVATIEGVQNTSGKAIGLRADMDALDILEAPNKPWPSKIPGKMHGCGHDGHTACLLGAAKYLSENPNFDGRVHLIFQPAEEGEKGAHMMIDEGLFRKYPCAQIFGLHNWPNLPLGTLATRTGPIMASSDTFHLTIKGRGGHAAKPDATIDPIVIGAQIVTALQTLVSRTAKPTDPAVLSITYFSAGTGAHNVIPDDAKITGTLRTYDEDLRQSLHRKIGEIARGIAQSMGGDAEYDFHFVIDPTINDPQATDFCVDIARRMFGVHNVDADVTPSMGGEDFGRMLSDVPGCYVWMGQGEYGDNADSASPHRQGLHTPRYDFNDDLIPLAVEYWTQIVENALPLKK
ncbi:MAG: amidohydrolase [Alphaproteobacteria bacterium]|nr:amidohydrolase [Alphaproteobacteria bacterium]